MQMNAALIGHESDPQTALLARADAKVMRPLRTTGVKDANDSSCADLLMALGRGQGKMATG